jgi:hypothetical protein
MSADANVIVRCLTKRRLFRSNSVRTTSLFVECSAHGPTWNSTRYETLRFMSVCRRIFVSVTLGTFCWQFLMITLLLGCCNLHSWLPLEASRVALEHAPFPQYAGLFDSRARCYHGTPQRRVLLVRAQIKQCLVKTSAQKLNFSSLVVKTTDVIIAEVYWQMKL